MKRIDTTGWGRMDFVRFYSDVWRASIVPLHVIGKKSPIIKWMEYQTRLPKQNELDKWFKDEQAWGLTMICGAVSGNLFNIDVDTKDKFRELKQAGAFDKGACIYETKKGFHVVMRADVIPRTLKEHNPNLPLDFWEVGISGDKTPGILPDTPNYEWAELYDDPVLVNYNAWLLKYLNFSFDMEGHGAEIRLQCPFHHPDEHASCFANKEKGVYYCQGCGARGKMGELIAELVRQDREVPKELQDYLQKRGHILKRMPWSKVVKEQFDKELIEGLIPGGENAKLLIIGNPKIGKTTLGLGIGVPAARGEKALKTQQINKPLRVGYANFEQYGDSIAEQIRRMSSIYGLPPDDMFIIIPAKGLKLNILEDTKEFMTMIAQDPPIELLILDGLYQAVENMNDPVHIDALLDFLSELVDEVHCAVVLLHHSAIPIVLGAGQMYDSAVGMLGKRLERWAGSRLFYTNIPYCLVDYYGRVKGEIRGGIGLVDYAVAYNQFSDSVHIVDWDRVPMERGEEHTITKTKPRARFFQQLWIYAEALGYTQADIAEALDAKQPSVSYWASGEQEPSDQYWQRILNLEQLLSSGKLLSDYRRLYPIIKSEQTVAKPEKNQNSQTREHTLPLSEEDTVSLFNKEKGGEPNCKKCPLNGRVRVEGWGDAPCDIMVIGEVPAEEEAKLGEPFVGRAGKYLNDLLAQMGLGRADCYITNACLCQLQADKKKPSVVAVRACLPRLMADIARVKPKTIILLGDTAVSAVLPDCSVGRYHGKKVVRDEVTYIIMYHPSAGLRHPAYRVVIDSDFKPIDEIPLVTEITGNYSIGKEGLSPASHENDFVCIDVETIGLYGKLLGGAVNLAPQSAVYYQSIVNLLKNCPEWQHFLAHNAKYEMHVLETNGFDWHGLEWDDAELLAYCMGYPSLKLPILTTQELNLDYPYSVEEEASFGDLPVEVTGHRCCQHCDSTRRLWDYLWEIADERERKVYTDIEKPLLPIIVDMERNGVRVDLDYVREWQAKLLKDIEVVTEELQSNYGLSTKVVNSPKQLGDWLAGEGVELSRTERSGQYATGKEILAGRMDDHPVIPTILRYRQLSKLNSTYASAYLKLADDNGYVHSNFHQARVVTARLSSSEPNLQNLPHRFDARRPFIASPECKLVGMDFSQVDMRAMAAVANDEALIEAYQDPKMDIHNWLADRLFGDHEPSHRYVVKSANYLSMFLGTAKGLHTYLNAPMGEFDLERMGNPPSLEQCEQIIRDYYDMLKGLGAWQERTKAEVLKRCYVEDYFGRRRYIYKVLSSTWRIREEGFREAVNFPIAGTAAELFKLSTARAGAIWTPCINIHDELIFDLPENRLDELIPKLQDAMTNIAFPVPLVVKCKTGNNLGELI